ncbi:MAG: hypothetical protein A3B38_01265 [Candidatus Levybacteria bacterium RIFCSPLOWO2_01_FULL_36_13]|nr:MAG: hypothetical protein A3B38_01265 [Candidatus Levybacteria bacterium RIFCSPLOWO2_01_FULL_36_13]
MSYKNERDPLRGRTVEQFNQEMDFQYHVRVDRARATGRRPDFRNQLLRSEVAFRSNGQNLSKK